jgi:sulfate adenylyltransferase
LTAETPGPIAPHGGTLIDRLDDSLDEGGGRPRVTLSARQQADLDLIAVGAMSPLDGFMGREAYESVMTDMRLPSGLAWSVPVTLAVPPDQLEEIGSADEVELVDEGGRFLGVLEVGDRFETDPSREARLVYGTEDDAHPGVASL